MAKSEKQEYLYFKSITLENVKCFGEPQTINFENEEGKPHQWTVILGENGTGKTTVLRTLCGMAPDPLEYIHLKETGKPLLDSMFDYIIRYEWNAARKVQKSDLDPVSLFFSTEYYIASALRKVKHIIDRECKVTYLEGDPFGSTIITFPEKTKFLLFAYGSSRVIAKTASGKKDIINNSNQTLFDDEAFLAPIEEIYSTVEDEWEGHKSKEEIFDIFKKLILSALPTYDKVATDMRRIKNPNGFGHIIQFQTPFGWLEPQELSYGTKTFIAWLIDFAGRMILFNLDTDKPFERPAVCLVDELDLHMHPKWQREVVPFLSKTFPNTQFIVTAHSPLLVQAAGDANLVLLKREGDQVVVKQDLPDIEDWRIDQIMNSELFDIPSLRSKKVQDKMEERRALIRKKQDKSLTPDEEKRLAELEKDFDEMPEGYDRHEQKAFDLLRNLANKLEERDQD